jgi:hypothetical protein
LHPFLRFHSRARLCLAFDVADERALDIHRARMPPAIDSIHVRIATTISLPALFAGSVLGILAFRNINELGFRRTILVVLLFSGASLAFA